MKTSLSSLSLYHSYLSCCHILYQHLSFLSSVPTSLLILHSFTPEAEGGGVIDRPVLRLHWIIPLPPLPLPGWQMGFLCWNTLSPSLSPQIGERAGERRAKGDSLSPTRPLTNDSATDKQCTVSVPLCFQLRQRLMVCHILQHQSCKLFSGWSVSRCLWGPVRDSLS